MDMGTANNGFTHTALYTTMHQDMVEHTQIHSQICTVNYLPRPFIWTDAYIH